MRMLRKKHMKIDALLLPLAISILSRPFLTLNAFCYYRKVQNNYRTVNVLLFLLPHFCSYFPLQTL